MASEAENGRPAPFEAPEYPKREKIELVGSAEAAQILGVEKPRIGRLIKRGVMPEQAGDFTDKDLYVHSDDRFPEGRLAAGPVWWREDIEMLLEARVKAGLYRSRKAPSIA